MTVNGIVKYCESSVCASELNNALYCRPLHPPCFIVSDKNELHVVRVRPSLLYLRTF